MVRKTDNEYLLRFDPTNASKEQIQLWLYAIIDGELEKDAEHMDEELIKECSDLEALMFEGEDYTNEADIEARLAKIKQRTEGFTVNKDVEKEKRIICKRSLKIALVFAAILLAMVLSIGTVAAINRMPAFEFIKTNIEKIMNMDSGDTIEDERITLTKDGSLKKYKTAEEAFKECNADILYPTVLPEGVKITKINQYYKETKDNYTISFTTTSPNINISVRNHTFTENSILENQTRYEINDLTFYITEVQYIYIASCMYKGFEYYIQSDDMDALKLIMENMKGLEFEK